MSAIRKSPKTRFVLKRARGAERRISCNEAKCQQRENGWVTILSLPAQQKEIDFIRTGKTGKRYLEEIESEGLVSFNFAPGQNCFREHWNRDAVFDIGKLETERASLWYPDGDAFIEDSDKHLRKLKEVLE